MFWSSLRVAEDLRSWSSGGPKMLELAAPSHPLREHARSLKRCLLPISEKSYNEARQLYSIRERHRS